MCVKHVTSFPIQCKPNTLMLLREDRTVQMT
uniref:Uncharacterized protein n=1 Tax=Anguilla anguilla TaxID=7936 RepID=A0A0E9W6R9_ANGAN